MRFGITGATGQLGRLVVAQLKTRVPGTDIVALVRSVPKAGDLGVTAREADYTKPETLERALAGLDTVLLISSTEVGQRAAQHRNVIETARRTGVKRTIYTSLLHADTSPLSLAGEHFATEAELKASDMSYTILRNGWYTENYTGSIPAALVHGAVLGSAGDGKISSATREDFAEAAVVVLLGEGHDGKTYGLAGDEAWTLADLAAELSRQTGREIPYRDLPEADYAAALIDMGLSGALARAIASFDVAASRRPVRRQP